VPDSWDAEPPVRVIQAWRQGDWVLVALDGRVVYRRLTRDRAFTHARVEFASNRSPSYPKSLASFSGSGGMGYTGRGVTLCGDWYTPGRGNSDTVPIHDGPDRGPEWAPYAAGRSGVHALLPVAMPDGAYAVEPF
jgi:hypothetical protein